MERIKEALERANAQREISPPAGQPSRKTPPAAGITYSQTRTVEVPASTYRKNRLVAAVDDDGSTAAYKMLRTQVLQRLKEKGWNALAITSPGEGEGKTLTALNLAISIAREVNHTVLLVDLDLRHPDVHSYFEYAPEKGLSDYLLHDTPLSEILFNPGIERLVVLPGRERFQNSSEVLSSPKLVALVEELKTRYPSRIVLFDLPPLLSADDALAFAPYVDAALLVIEEGRTSRDDVLKAMEYLSATNVLGTVLNRSEEKIAGY